MLRDRASETTQRSLTSERANKEVRYLSDNLEFSANATSLFLSQPVNRDFISWEDHYQFDSLESLLTANKIPKRSAISRKPTGVKQHTCHFERQEISLPPIVKLSSAAKSAGIRKVKSRRSNFSVHSIPMDPSVDWVNTISSTVNNFETVYLKSDSLTRLSPDPSLSGSSPTERHTPDTRLPEFLAEWEAGQKPVFQPLSTLTEEEIVLDNGMRFDKVLEPIIPARQCHLNVAAANDNKSHGKPQGHRRWQNWPKPHKNVRSEGWLSVPETIELEEERREQERAAALSLVNRKIDTYRTGSSVSKETEGSEFFLEEETGFRETMVIEEWLHKWSLPIQESTVSDVLQQLNSVNQLVRVQGACLCALSCLPEQEAGARLALHPQLEEPLQRLLSDESMKVRITAATVLSFSRFEETAALKDILLEGVASSDVQERWLSCQALACLLVPDASVLKELASKLISDSPRERSRALTLMGRLSPCSVTVHAMAADMVTRRHWKQKIAGCSLVPLLNGGPKKDFQERLVRIMWRDWHSKVREAAARALGRAGKGRLIHDEILLKLTDSENDDLRLDALHKIRELKPPIRHLIPGLLSCLEDNIISIRISCIKLVAELQIRDEDILDALIELLTDDNWKVKLEAIKALSQLSGSVSSPQLIASHLLWAGRYDRAAIVRTSALSTLSVLARDLPHAHSDLKTEIINSLIEALSSDTEDSVREEAERGLLLLGEEPRQEDKLLEAIREEIKKLGHPADIAASILQSS